MKKELGDAITSSECCTINSNHTFTYIQTTTYHHGAQCSTHELPLDPPISKQIWHPAYLQIYSMVDSSRWQHLLNDDFLHLAGVDPSNPTVLIERTDDI